MRLPSLPATGDHNLFESLYFAVVTFATVGFGNFNRLPSLSEMIKVSRRCLSRRLTLTHSRSHISYMFCFPSAAENVFSAPMLDTLLYQTFVKDYMIAVLATDKTLGLVFLSSMRINRDDCGSEL